MELLLPTRFRLAEAIEEAGTNQSALAKKAGVSVVTVNAIANNRTEQVRLSTLDKLADALGLEPGELLEREGKRTAPAKTPRGTPGRRTRR